MNGGENVGKLDRQKTVNRSEFMVVNEKFNRAVSSFDELEKRGSFYDMAINLLNNNFEIEAYLLILATWHFAQFRYAVKDFGIQEFKEKIGNLHPFFNKMKDESFRTIHFDKYQEDIRTIFDTLSKIKGVGPTGAPKIMHLANRNVFVMWDRYIRGSRPKRYYNKLEIAHEGWWTLKRYGNDGKSYVQFLKDTQKIFRNVLFQEDKKTFAKAVDEFYFVKITLPIQEKEKEEKKTKKTLKILNPRD